MSDRATEITEPTESLIRVEDLDAVVSDPIEAQALPCPFCGSGGALVILCGTYVTADDGSWANLQCNNCGMLGPGGVGNFRDAACHAAVAKWNERKLKADG